MSQQKTSLFKSVQAAGGHARAASMTPEQRSACAKNAATARWQFRNGSQITGTPDSGGPYRGNDGDGLYWKAQREPCAICKAPRSSHQEKTNACPKITSGHDETYTFLSRSLVPKSKPDLVAAYGMALDAINRAQAERFAARKALAEIRTRAHDKKTTRARIKEIASAGLTESGPFVYP